MLVDQGVAISNNCFEFGDVLTEPIVGNASPPVAVPECDLNMFSNPITKSMESASEKNISESDRRKPLPISPNITAPLCSAGTDDTLDKLELSVQKLTAAMDPKVAHHIENSLEISSVTTDDTPETGNYPYGAD